MGAKNKDQSQNQLQARRQASMAFASLAPDGLFDVDSAQKHCLKPPALPRLVASPTEISQRRERARQEMNEEEW